MKYYVWLQSAIGAGNSNTANIIRYFKTAENVYNSTSKQREQSGVFSVGELKRLEKLNISFAEEIVKECNDSGIEIIPFGSEKYPYCLSVISNPPLLLYVKGNFPDFDKTPAICIVGPRKVSEFGKKAAYSIAYRLSSCGMIVVSGGALGSDSYAHSGALKSGGKTVLVMGCGINSSYLAENAELRNLVSKNGCLISEYPPKQLPTRYSFPVRNRILSGLCVGTVVIEAGQKSGALITAGCANEQGRDVFVIPGSPKQSEYIGSNALLRDGAKPLLDIFDIFNEYVLRFPDKINLEMLNNKIKIDKNNAKDKKILKDNKKLTNETLSKEAKIVYNQLNKHKFYPEEIKNTGLTSQELLSALTELEMEFIIKAVPGGQFELIDL